MKKFWLITYKAEAFNGDLFERTELFNGTIGSIMRELLDKWDSSIIILYREEISEMEYNELNKVNFGNIITILNDKEQKLI